MLDTLDGIADSDVSIVQSWILLRMTKCFWEVGFTEAWKSACSSLRWLRHGSYLHKRVML